MFQRFHNSGRRVCGSPRTTRSCVDDSTLLMLAERVVIDSRRKLGRSNEDEYHGTAKYDCIRKNARSPETIHADPVFVDVLVK